MSQGFKSVGTDGAAAQAAAYQNAQAAAANAELDAMLGVGTYLTIEEMFAFAELQLAKFDSQLRAHMVDVQSKRDKAAKLNAISAELKSVANADKTAQLEMFDKLIGDAKAAGLTDAVAVLEKYKAARLEKQGALEETSINAGAQEIDAIASELTSSTELTMIRVQDLMQKRSQLLQLASNVVAAINEPAKNAIANIRGS